MRRYTRPVTFAAALGVVFSLCARNAFAQIIGLNGGLSLAPFGGAETEEFGSTAGIRAGATATFPLSGNLSLRVGAAFAEKGGESAESNFDTALALDYIEVPVMLSLGIPVDGIISPRLAVGPAVGF